MRHTFLERHKSGIFLSNRVFKLFDDERPKSDKKLKNFSKKL